MLFPSGTSSTTSRPSRRSFPPTWS
jgi:hypothetical protein